MTFSLFLSVHAVLGLPLPDCLEVEPVSSIVLTSQLMLCLDHFFPGNSFTILAPASLSLWSMLQSPLCRCHWTPSSLMNRIWSAKMRFLYLYLKQIASLMSYWNVTLWHLDMLTSNIWQPIPLAPDCLVPWINDIAESDLQFSMTSHFMAIWCTVMKLIPPISL